VTITDTDSVFSFVLLRTVMFYRAYETLLKEDRLMKHYHYIFMFIHHIIW